MALTLHLAYYPTEFSNMQALLQQNFENLQLKPQDNQFYALMLRIVSAEERNTNEQNLESFFWLHRHQHAMMRLLFRIGLRINDLNPEQQAQRGRGAVVPYTYTGASRDNHIYV